jgi:hypothetical protein
MNINNVQIVVCVFSNINMCIVYDNSNNYYYYY